MSPNVELKNFIQNPTQSKDNQHNLIRLLADKLSFSKILRILCFINRKKKNIFIGKIIDSFLKLCLQKRGELKHL